MRHESVNEHRRAIVGVLALLLMAGGLATVAATAAPAAAQASSFTFVGGGWGHGVGMSQYGAKGRAEAGQGVGDILGAYYPGTQYGGLGLAVVRVQLTSVTPGTGIGIQVEGTGVTVNGGTTPLAPGSSHTLAPNSFIDLNGSVVRLPALGNRYRFGRLTVTPSGNVVLSIEMQQYLYGLAEMPSSWSIEALKAQAIAGRTYAWRRILNPVNGEYDIRSNTLDQVYAGAEKELGLQGSRWISAVDTTQLFGLSLVLTHGGPNTPAETYYSSSNGGWSERAGYVFATDRPYLQVATDVFDQTSDNPNFRWTRTYTGTELGQYVRDSGRSDIGTVTGVDFSGNIGGSGRIDRATVKVTGTGGSHTMTGNQFRSMVNGSNPTLARQLMSTLLFFKPIGGFDVAGQVPDGIRVQGWSAVQGLSGSAFTHIYVNGQFATSVAATGSRADVSAAVPGVGPNSGFDTVVAPTGAVNSVCAYSVTPSGNAATALGCRVVTVAVDPIGSVDVATRTPEGARVAGWALDPNSSGAIGVHVYVNGQLRAAVDANGARSDIAAAFPGYGAAHGYDVTVRVDGGTNAVCAYAINAGPGTNRLLGCRTIAAVVDPIGSLDVARGTASGIEVGGWALDPDTREPVEVHVYVDGTLKGAYAANGVRGDIAAAFPNYGANHGYSGEIPMTPGTHQVCAYGVNRGAGSNATLGCRTVTVAGDPFGSLDVAARTLDGRVAVAGWAIDPNTTAPIDVHVYVDNTLRAAAPANGARGDLAAAFPSSGINHGFNLIVSGGQRVCVYAINAGPGSNALIACRTI